MNKYTLKIDITTFNNFDNFRLVIFRAFNVVVRKCDKKPKKKKFRK